MNRGLHQFKVRTLSICAWSGHGGTEVGDLVFLGLLAFASMFRRPLIYLSRKAMGLPVVDPRTLRR